MEFVSHTEATTENIKQKSHIRYRKERCPVCGSLLLRLNKSRHQKTKKHKEANYIWHEQFEPT